MTDRKPIVRPTARVILLDEIDRIFLFRYEVPAGDSFAEEDDVVLTEPASLWSTPGGGVEEGETPEETALRELFEETGLTDVTISACVWQRSLVFRMRGEAWDFRESFFLARVPAFEADISGHTELEQNEIKEHRWWTMDEIEASPDRFAPRDLALLLRPLIQGELPAQPITVGV